MKSLKSWRPPCDASQLRLALFAVASFIWRALNEILEEQNGENTRNQKSDTKRFSPAPRRQKTSYCFSSYTFAFSYYLVLQHKVRLET